MLLGGLEMITYIAIMTKGRINSEGSMNTASRVLRDAGGSWVAIERIARRNEDGVYVVRRKDLDEIRRNRGGRNAA
jgi:hypothetical protein